MNSFYSYKMINTEIECTQATLEALYFQYEQTYKILKINLPKDIGSIDYTNEIKSKYVPISLDRIIEKLNEISENININQDILEKLMFTKRELEKFISSNKGIYYKIAYLKYVDDLTLKEISCKLHMSYSTIRHMNQTLNKLYNQHIPQK